jgi:hypothetical protein
MYVVYQWSNMVYHGKPMVNQSQKLKNYWFGTPLTVPYGIKDLYSKRRKGMYMAYTNGIRKGMYIACI